MGRVPRYGMKRRTASTRRKPCCCGALANWIDVAAHFTHVSLSMTPAKPIDDVVAPFSLDGAPVRGRIARLGPEALDPILHRHDYPRPVAMLLGEALTLAGLVGSLLKVDGRLVVQAQGEGLVPLLVAEHSDGGLRGYARLADGAADQLKGANRLPPAALLGAGSLVLTLDRGEGKPTYQGVVALDGA